jgi:prephenate dehydrogenase
VLDEPDFPALGAARVAIVGLGLMGGSLALALRGQCAELIGADVNEVALLAAVERGVVDRAAAFPMRDCDLLVLAAPVRVILAQLAELAQWPGPARPITVLDLGSTKAQIAAAMSALPAGYHPLGGHPMCGKETSGLDQAEGRLFRGRVFVLSPLERTPPGALRLAQALVEAVGALPCHLEAERHDRLAARVSHLPYAAAAALVRAAETLPDEHVWTLAASGFRDTSRLAASEVSMMLDTLLTNRPAVLDSLRRYRAELDDLARLLEAGDEPALRAWLTAARERRRGLFQT